MILSLANVSAYWAELEKIAEGKNRLFPDPQKRRRAAVGVSAGLVGAAGLAAGGAALPGVVRRLADTFSSRVEVGLRRGIDEGVTSAYATILANVKKDSPGIAKSFGKELEQILSPKVDDIIAQASAAARTEAQAAIDLAASRARKEMPGLSSALASGVKAELKESVTGRLTGMLRGR